jgi:hypothetical protein
MKRGIWIEGQVTDKVTGEPVDKATVSYVVFRDNPHAKDAPGLNGAIGDAITPYDTTPDGSFRRVGLPSRGLLAVRVAQGYEYRFGVGADKIEGGQPIGGSVLFHTAPRAIISSGYNALVEINPTEDQDRYECNIVLDPGTTIAGEVLDPEGRPLTGALVWGANDYGGPWADEPLEGSQFEAIGYEASKPRHLFFLHKERRLAGHLTVQGERPDDLSVRLQPWATISGRILDGEGNPKGGLEIVSVRSLKQDPASDDSAAGPLPPQDKYAGPRHYTDDDGRFKLEGLVPEVKYTVMIGEQGSRTVALILFDESFRPGETKSMGDVPLEDAEVVGERYEIDSER